MFGLNHIKVDFLTGQPVVVILGCLVLLGLAGLLYWQTNPPLPRWLRIILGLFRVVAVIALIAALSEPVIGYTRQYDRSRRTTVLIDRSASMDRLENGRTRAMRVDSLLNSEPARSALSSNEVTTYYFAGGLGDRPNDVDKNQTALGSVLQELNRRELARPADQWLLFSDGNSNNGPLPAEIASSLNTPIVAVGMAVAGAEADIGLTDVDYNAVVFAGQPTEIKAKLRWDGAQTGTVPIKLLDSGRVVAESSLKIDQESGLADVSLRWVPSRPGQTLLNVKIDPLPQEVDTNNNARTFSVKVLKSQVAVLLACESPDYEVGFLNRFLRQSGRYEVKLIVLGTKAGNLAGRFPAQQTELNRYDLVILYDPIPARLANLHDLLKSYLSERGGGLWVFLGSRYSGGTVSARVAELLPFYPSGTAQVVYTPFHGSPVEGQLFHPSVRLADSRAEIREIWAGLPPFRMLVPCDQIAQGSIVLAEASGPGDLDSRIPILGYRRLGPGKVLMISAAPLWSWGFETLNYGAAQAPYARMVEGTVNWLTVQDDFDPVRIAPEKAVYRRGEPVRFDGFAFDPGYRPIPGVTGSVTLTGAAGSEPVEADLIQTEEGRLRGEFSNLSPGEYSYEATLSRDEQVLRTNRGRILVEPFSAEEYDQRGDPASLTALANATGGSYHDFKDFTAAVGALDRRPVTESVSGEIVLWGKLWLLLIFIAALAIEWGVRKFSHLL